MTSHVIRFLTLNGFLSIEGVLQALVLLLRYMTPTFLKVTNRLRNLRPSFLLSIEMCWRTKYSRGVLESFINSELDTIEFAFCRSALPHSQQKGMDWGLVRLS